MENLKVFLDELESQLLTQEACNEKFKKASLTYLVTVNLTQNSNYVTQVKPSNS